MISLFKGYVPTKDKKCLMPFKNATSAELRTYKQVKNLPEFAGILADEVIMVDVDDYEQSEILMEIVEDLQLRCRVYETTRGKHFLFRNNGVDKGKTKTAVACGLMEIDMKVGHNNSYSILKQRDKERKIIYDIFEDEDYEEIPKWLFPLKSRINFRELKEGDGRNQALFNYILTLQSNDFSNDEAKETIRILNKYVLVDSLEENELETILRNESFQKPIFFRKQQFLFDVFAKFLKNNHNIIKINGRLHIYKDGVYIEGYKKIESEMIKHISNLSKSKRQEVLSYMDIMIGDNATVSPANFIAFKNGIYDLNEDELLPFSPNLIITNKINFDYVPNSYSDIADNTLNKLACNDVNIRMLLEEAIGYCFYRRNELRKCFILTGDKQNGKSTYLSMIEHLLGQENITSLDLKELGEKFKAAELFGKLANIGDDIGDEFIANPAIFKKLVSGNPINVEKKGQDPFDFSNYSKMLFSANNIPRIKDKSGAVISRLVIVPFDAKFTVNDPDFDPYIKYKLTQDEPMQYLIQIGLNGLKRVLANQKFTTSKKVEKSIVEYEENNNPILIFFKEDIQFENEPTRAIYMKYCEFCAANSFTPMSNIEFSKQVKKHLDLEIVDKTIKGKKYRIFVKV